MSFVTIKEVFARAFTGDKIPQITKDEVNSTMDWELWVQNFLGLYLDILPLDRVELLRYTIDRLLVLLEPEQLSDREKVSVVGAFQDALEEHFPAGKIVRALDVRNFLEKTSQWMNEMRALGLVYAFQRRRAARLGYEHANMWDGVPTRPASPEEGPLDIETLLEEDTRRELERLSKRSDFLKNVSIFCSFSTKWDIEELDQAFKSLASDWAGLDEYTRRDLRPLYNQAQQYNKTI